MTKFGDTTIKEKIMLVRNLSKVSLNLRKHGTKVVLLPGKVTEVNDVLFTKEQVKAIYGNFVQILNEDLAPAAKPATIEAPAVKTVAPALKEEPKAEEKVEEKIEDSEAEEKVEEPEAKIEEPAKEDEIEEVCLAGIANLAEEIVEEAKVVEAPKKKATKKSTKKK